MIVSITIFSDILYACIKHDWSICKYFKKKLKNNLNSNTKYKLQKNIPIALLYVNVHKPYPLEKKIAVAALMRLADTSTKLYN